MTVAVKGFVRNGVIEVIGIAQGQVVGYKRPLHRKASNTASPISVVPTPQTKHLDVPSFMKQRSKDIQEQRSLSRKFKHIR